MTVDPVWALGGGAEAFEIGVRKGSTGNWFRIIKSFSSTVRETPLEITNSLQDWCPHCEANVPNRLHSPGGKYTTHSTETPHLRTYAMLIWRVLFMLADQTTDSHTVHYT